MNTYKVETNKRIINTRASYREDVVGNANIEEWEKVLSIKIQY